MSLKDQIDEPLLKSVMAINLLGATTVWTCCGYDYPGQPEDKKHLYGTWQIHLLANDTAATVGVNIIRNVPGIKMFAGHLTGIPVIHLTINFRDIGLPECWQEYKNNQHAHEMGSMYSSNLERYLLNLKKDVFKEVVAIEDTNEKVKKIFKHWAHPISEAWVITREDLFK
jgi:hypothetical protein